MSSLALSLNKAGGMVTIRSTFGDEVSLWPCRINNAMWIFTGDGQATAEGLSDYIKTLDGPVTEEDLHKLSHTNFTLAVKGFSRGESGFC